jgi:phosphate transport system substrate-binding protein
MPVRLRRDVLQGIGILFLSAAAVAAQTEPKAQPVQINGAGATLPYPIYSAWFAEYAKIRPDVQFNYLSIGSGGGISQLVDLLVFFAASDTPMIGEEYQATPGRIIHLPTVVGAVAPIYNLPGLKGELRFDGALLANIFLGKIRNWNDPAIAALNPGVTLPPTDIAVVLRSDSSGSSFIFTDFLSKISPEWNRVVGPNRAPSLPHALAARGSEGMAAIVKQIPGSIGYLDLIYATRNQIDIGLVRNQEGEFIRPSVASTAAAAVSAVGAIPRDFRVSITNAPGKGVYPISSFTWILIYERPRDGRRSRLMVEFLKWALTEGQKLAPDLGYAPLPPELAARGLAALKTIRVS